MFDIAKFVLSVKIALTTLKLKFLDTYTIIFNDILYRRPVQGENRDSERTYKIA